MYRRDAHFSRAIMWERQAIVDTVEVVVARHLASMGGALQPATA